MTYRAEINKALRDLLADDKVILLGQSIRDPYGGACKVTRGLSTAFDSQVLDMPICEAATIGIAVGLAMNGYKPVVEIMFADFMTLCVDQLFNTAHVIDSFHQHIKIVIRTMTGADLSYGPTHSRGMLWLLRALPARVERITLQTDIAGSYRRAFTDEYPVVILLEDKSLYGENMVCM